MLYFTPRFYIFSYRVFKVFDDAHTGIILCLPYRGFLFRFTIIIIHVVRIFSSLYRPSPNIIQNQSLMQFLTFKLIPSDIVFLRCSMMQIYGCGFYYLYIYIYILKLLKLLFQGVDVVEWSRALDVRLSEWCCSVTMVWVQIPSREEQKFDSSKI